MKKNLMYIPYVLVILLLGCLLFKNCSSSKEIKQLTQAYNTLNTEYKSYKDSTGKLVVEQTQTILSQKNALSMGLITEERLKALNIKTLQANINLKQQLSIAGKTLHYVDTPQVLYVNELADTGKFIRVPQRIDYLDPYFHLKCRVFATGILIDTMIVPINNTITIGYKKAPGFWGFLKKSIPKVIYTTDNPYVKVMQMNNVVVQKPKRWYNAKGLYYGLGVLSGVLILKSL